MEKVIQARTETYAIHEGIPLECDIYTSPDFTQDAPAFLYFHAGGLVGGNRRQIPPWLIQKCFQSQWPLISVDYRLAPQAKGREYEADAKAAAGFASTLDTADGKSRKLIVGGSSAGFFFATVLARSADFSSSIVALLSICGIPSFQHEFFTSSTLLTPEPIPPEEAKYHEDGPMIAWLSEKGDPAMFELGMLNADGTKNEDYVKDPEKGKNQGPTSGGEGQDTDQRMRRGMLYDYYLYNNAFPSLVHPIDPGFPQSAPETLSSRQAWPTTIVIHGDADVDFPLQGSLWMRDSIGSDKVKVFVAKGRGHLFEAGFFLVEDGQEGMEAVREAAAALEEFVQMATGPEN